MGVVFSFPHTLAEGLIILNGIAIVQTIKNEKRKASRPSFFRL